MKNIKLLKKIGLSKAEIDVYKAILEAANSDMQRIAAKSGVPRTRIYDIAGELYKKGFLRKTNSRPVKYTAINPEKVIQEKAVEFLRNFDDLSGELLELWEQDAVSPKDDTNGFIIGNITGLISECKSMIQSAEKNIVMNISTLCSFTKNSKLFKDVKQGVKVKIFADREFVTDGKKIEIIKAKRIDCQFLAIDNDRIMIILENKPQEFQGIGIKDERIVSLFVEKFKG